MTNNDKHILRAVLQDEQVGDKFKDLISQHYEGDTEEQKEESPVFAVNLKIIEFMPFLNALSNRIKSRKEDIKRIINSDAQNAKIETLEILKDEIAVWTMEFVNKDNTYLEKELVDFQNEYNASQLFKEKIDKLVFKSVYRPNFTHAHLQEMIKDRSGGKAILEVDSSEFKNYIRQHFEMGKKPYKDFKEKDGYRRIPVLPIGGVDTQKHALETVYQRAILVEGKGKKASELSLEQFAIMHFVSKARAEFEMLGALNVSPVGNFSIAYQEAIKSEKAIETKKDNKSNRLLGKKITLILPNGEKRNAQFAIVELDAIKASHNEKTFVTTKGYPVNANGDNINDRNYEGDANAQAQVVEYARNLQPERLINTSRTPSGTPIIDKNGIVVSGNNRTMSTKLAATDYIERYFEYKKFLVEEWSAFGFPTNPKEKRLNVKFKKLFLVRIDYDIPSLTTKELAKYNQSTMKGKRPVDKVVEMSNILRENQTCQTNLPKILNDFETMSDFYKNGNAQKQMVDMLKGCELVTQQQLPEIYTNGFFTQNGKNFLESVLGGIVLNKEAILTAERDGVKSLRKAIVNALPVLMTNQTLSENSLLTYINDAIVYQGKLVAANLPFSLFINQISAFKEKQFDAKSIYINRLLNKGQRAFKRAILKYNNTVNLNSGAALFASETVSPSEAFETHILSEIPESEVKLIKQFAGEAVEVTSAKAAKTFKNSPIMHIVEKAKNDAVAKDFFLEAVKKVAANKGEDSMKEVSYYGYKVKLYHLAKLVEYLGNKFNWNWQVKFGDLRSRKKLLIRELRKV